MRALPPSLGRHLSIVGHIGEVDVSVHPIVNVHQPPLLAQLCVYMGINGGDELI
jgi:hypothetical protein